MPLPLLTTLNAAARQAFPIIKAGVTQGLPSRAINSIIKKTFGRGIRRSVLLDIIRAETGLERANVALKFITPGKRPSFNRLPTALTRIRRNFSFIVKVTGSIIGTGESIIQNITISTNTIFTRGELEAMAEELVTSAQDRYKFIVDSAQLTSGVRAGEVGTL